jgi:hypothetical protein
MRVRTGQESKTHGIFSNNDDFGGVSPLRAAMMNKMGKKIIQKCGREQQKRKSPVPKSIKKIACHKEQKVLVS